ncbi:PREDICTED: UPF0415 protein C7orf25 homolog [Eufriesea mexicana]|uniref:UPF0415 protein C7orf25 homolog n=1 Tax=Eufriesea mexicana TaxID=516756 RepID=UPI00083BC3FE|nr:PREDICTED: UPF0415 protein C7orf25 homolog [Eufriesea mexicana]
MEEKAELLTCLEEKIDSGKATIDRLKLVVKIDGIEKLIRKIQQEIRFLEKVQSTGNVKKEHLQSTNLIHLNAIVARLFGANQPTNIMKPFKYQKSRLEVDIVCNSGASWIKVIARNARALTMISMGNGEYGQKSVLDQATSYLECAKCHPHLYRPPDVIFHFAYGIETPLAACLERMGVIVEGDKIQCVDVTNVDIHEIDNESRVSTTWMYSLELSEEQEPLDEYEQSINSDLNTLNTSFLKTEIKILNLDVSTLLAYVTNMTNGYDYFIYREPLLTQQAEMERKSPVKPVLENLFKGKELIVCQTAYENFMNIIDVIGGPKETVRAKELLNKVRIVNNVTTGRIMEKLSLGGKIKDRSRLVFATGEDTKSITVSANEGFVRAARMQGIECTVFLHEPRSLSEIKERYATKIDTS